MVGFCEGSDELSGFLKSEEVLDYPRNDKLSHKDSTVWSFQGQMQSIVL